MQLNGDLLIRLFAVNYSVSLYCCRGNGAFSANKSNYLELTFRSHDQPHNAVWYPHL